MKSKLYYIIITHDNNLGRNIQNIVNYRTAHTYDDAVRVAMDMFREHPEHNKYGFGEAYYKKIEKEIYKTGWISVCTLNNITLSILKLGK